jgi:peptidoglycan-N-acetylglucosamine deacetylase
MTPSMSRFKTLGYACNGIGLLASYIAKQPQTHDVWITFDDGPHPIHTVSILDTLRRHSARATFFWIGEQAERHIDIVRRAVDEGHHVGNHSYSHPFLTRLHRTAIVREIMRTDEVLAPYYNGARLFRPPHGDHDEIVDQVVEEAGYQTVLWNLSTRDWHRLLQPRLWVHVGSLLVRMEGSGIVLMHADLAGTADHLDQFLSRIQRRGAAFMPPDTLLPHWFAGEFA